MRFYIPSEWPHGLRCGECSRLFEEGMLIADQFAGMLDEIPMTVAVCVPCGLEKPVACDA